MQAQESAFKVYQSGGLCIICHTQISWCRCRAGKRFNLIKPGVLAHQFGKDKRKQVESIYI